MGTLVLELKPGEMMVINGAPLRFRTKSTIELAGRARFLFGKQIMPSHEANSPARRIYFAVQSAYIGAEVERASALARLHDLILAFQEATTSGAARLILETLERCALDDDCYTALKLARRIIRHEDALLRPNARQPAGRTLHAAPPPLHALPAREAVSPA